MRPLVFALLLLAPAANWAQDCYFFWVHQCIEVIDASKRQLRQYALVSPQIYHLSTSSNSCTSAVTEQQSAANDALLAAFSASAAKISACQGDITALPARAFSSMSKAQWHYNRARKPGPNKLIVVVENLPSL